MKVALTSTLPAGMVKVYLAVALVLERQLIAVLVGDSQGLEDVAAVGLDGDGHGVALAGALRADGHGAVLGLARGRDGVGRVVGAAAAGVGRRVADRPDTVRSAAHIVIACQSAGGVCQIHAGGQTGFCKNRVGISALAAITLDDVGVAVAHNVNARIAAERAAGDGDGCIRRTALNNRSLCSSKLTAGNVHNRILAADFGNSICGTGERTTGHGKSTKINTSTTTTVVNAVCLCVSITCSSKGAACDLCNIVILNNGLIIVAERTAIDR